MKIIDTHSHLYLDDFEQDLETVVSRAKQIGVEKILLPNIDENTIQSLKTTVARFPDIFIPMMGLHPTNVTDNWEKQLEIIHDELNSSHYIAIGEIGLDLYWNKQSIKNQKAAFEKQLEWSIDRNLPVVIHSRDAILEVIDSIKKVDENKLYGVFHSFGGNAAELEEILNLKNFFLGLNGVVTFKNSGLKETLLKCPLNKIVIETDSPYLAPVPYRGKRNESAYISEIVKTLSVVYNIPEIEITEITTQNATELFSLTL